MKFYFHPTVGTFGPGAVYYNPGFPIPVDDATTDLPPGAKWCDKNGSPLPDTPPPTGGEGTPTKGTPAKINPPHPHSETKKTK